MSADAMVRLRADVERYPTPRVSVNTADLRALLDAHTEALDALALFADSGHWSWEYRWTADTVPPFEIARAILAKVGRR